jgi:hypothetical protein
MLQATSQNQVARLGHASGHCSVPPSARPLLESTMKRCSKCHTEHPATAEFFPPDKRRRDGVGSWCRVCHRIVVTRWAVAHPEAKCAIRTRHRNAHPESGRAAAARYRVAHPEVRRAAVARWQAKHPVANAAHRAAYNAVRTGCLTRPSACERCGQPSSRLDKHHADYSRPLDVIFVCPRCHRNIHTRRFV